MIEVICCACPTGRLALEGMDPASLSWDDWEPFRKKVEAGGWQTGQSVTWGRTWIRSMCPACVAKWTTTRYGEVPPNEIQRREDERKAEYDRLAAAKKEFQKMVVAVSPYNQWETVMREGVGLGYRLRPTSRVHGFKNAKYLDDKSVCGKVEVWEDYHGTDRVMTCATCRKKLGLPPIPKPEPPKEPPKRTGVNYTEEDEPYRETGYM